MRWGIQQDSKPAIALSERAKVYTGQAANLITNRENDMSKTLWRNESEDMTMPNIISFDEYMQDRQADRIADEIIKRFYPMADSLVTIEEVEAATDKAIRQAQEYDEVCKRG